MSRRVLIVQCHPVAESFVGACVDRARAALAAGGHEIRLIDLYADGFDPVLGAEEWRNHLVPAEEKPSWTDQLGGYAASLRWCDTLVLAYPTWFGGQPAMLKGWFDRVLVSGVAFSLPAGASRIRPLLRNVRLLMVVTTHGSEKRHNAVQGEPGKRTAGRGVRSLCHPLARTRWVAFYGNDTCAQRDRADFLNRVEAEFLRL